MNKHFTYGFARRAVLGVSMSTAFLVLLATAPDVSAADAAEGPLPPGYSLARTGEVHDFDYFVGGWTTKQRRLKARGVGSTEWEEFPAIQCLTPYLEGRATVDELYMPTKKRAGLTVRVFDIEKHQWAIYWVTGESGPLDPVVGGFDGKHGEFYALDEDDHRPVKVRYMWDKIDNDHARWQQAFSFDNKTWETNWIGEFTRADASKVCDNGRPRR